MRRILLAAAAPLLLMSPEPVRAQSGGDTLVVEKAAFQYVVSRQATPASASTLTYGISPEIAERGSAPPAPSAETRAAARHALLVQALKVASVRRADAFECAQRVCAARGPELLISLSNPLFDKDTATISVTAEGVARGRLFYETLDLVLVRVNGRWTVARSTQIGIS